MAVERPRHSWIASASSELIQREEQRLNARTPTSGEMYRARARGASARRRVLLPAPRPVADLPRARRRPEGRGTSTATRCWDFHNGFGSMVQGHAHPAIGRALAERYAPGTHFAAPTEDAVVVAEELAAPLGPAALALHELRLGVDDGRHPDRARATRAATP